MVASTKKAAEEPDHAAHEALRAIRAKVEEAFNEDQLDLLFPLIDDEYEGSNSSVHQLREDITPEAYLRYAETWARSGADIIGGCCGITPEHIRVLSEALKSPPPVALPDYA